MDSETLNAIREHALAEYPRECCGLVVIHRGKERYLRCVNKAHTRSEHFIIAADDYAFAEDQGEITMVVHSHPDVPARPSQADLTACESSGLPWGIVSVMPDSDGKPQASQMHTFAPSGYDPGYVGVEFAHGINDCYSLIRRWYKRERGITLPNFDRPDEWWNDGHSSLYLDHFEEAGFVDVTGKPLEAGDVLLLQIRSRNRVPNHAAIYLGDGLILQHLYGRLSSRDVWGGYWQECHRLTVRYAGGMLPVNRVTGEQE